MYSGFVAVAVVLFLVSLLSHVVPIPDDLTAPVMLAEATEEAGQDPLEGAGR